MTGSNNIVLPAHKVGQNVGVIAVSGTATATTVAAGGNILGLGTTAQTLGLPGPSFIVLSDDGTNWNITSCSANIRTVGGITLSAALNLGTGTNSDACAAITSPTITSGVSFTPSIFTDVELSFIVAIAGTMTFTMGPSTGTENTVIVGGTSVVIGTYIAKRIPKGWVCIITLVTATLSNAKIQVL
jgi:hypothetical protein